MKKVIFAFSTLFVMGVNAQEVKFGAKLGGSLATTKFSYPNNTGLSTNDFDNKMLFGFHIGGFVEISLTKKFAIQPELLYSMEGTKYELIDSQTSLSVISTEKSVGKIKMNYINVPLLAKYYAIDKLYLVAGPQFGFLTSAKQDEDYTYTVTGQPTQTINSKDVNVKKDYKSLNISASFGGGYHFTDAIFVEARYNIGLSNIAEPQTISTPFGDINYEPVAKSNNLQFSVGYKF